MPNELNEALAKGCALSFHGQDWRVRPLDFCDLVDIEEKIGDVELLDITKLKHQLLLLWLVLRKADPTLGDDDRKNRRYRMTMNDVGSLVDAAELQKPETVIFITECLRVSGVLPKMAEQTEPAAPSEEPKKKKTRRSASVSVG